MGYLIRGLRVLKLNETTKVTVGSLDVFPFVVKNLNQKAGNVHSNGGTGV